MLKRVCSAFLGLALVAILQPALASAQSVGEGGVGTSGAEDVPDSTGNVLISAVEVEWTGTVAPVSEPELRADVLRALGLAAGDRYDELLLGQGLARVRKVDGVGGVDYRLVRRVNPSGFAIILVVDAGTPQTKASTTEGKKGFPVLYQDDRTLIRVILNGGVGVLNDVNPWFGQPETFTKFNPLVQEPQEGAQTGDVARWVENYIEYGLGAATQVGNNPFYIYGAGTMVTAMSAGQDIFRDDSRATTNVEKLYAGFLYVPQDGGPQIQVTAGRQNFTLNDGWLVAQYGSQWNAGPRPGIYLAPRTTHDLSAVSTVNWNDKWTWTSFFLDPNEYEEIESNTQLVGTNLRYNHTESAYGDVTYMYIPRSDSNYAVPGGGTLPREGLSTFAGHLRWANREVIDGLWLEAEAALQRHDDFDMNAWAAYGTVGYLARDVKWTPSLSYRYSYFSGDDPDTESYERFDSLYSGGLSEWLQGITINKGLSQSNRGTHRVRLNVAPSEQLNLTVDYFLHRADELNNLGGNPALSQLSSHDLGQEIQFVTRWAINRNLYFVGVASHAIPGDAIEDATSGEAEPWTSLQAQLYWNF